MFLRHLQAFKPPNTVNGILAHAEALKLQHRGDRFVAVSTILSGEFNDSFAQLFTIWIDDRSIPLSCANLTNNPASKTLRDVMRFHCMQNGLTSASRA